MTRAKKVLVLSRATYRRSYGEERLRASLPSRFIGEIPPDMIEAAAGSQSEPGETRRYEPDPEFSDGSSYQRGRSRYAPSYPPNAYAKQARPRPAADAQRRESPGQSPRQTKDPLVGARVRHSKYGIGTIIGVEGEGDDRRLTVSFQDFGAKKLVERYANFQLA